jgi:hypothetical protein
MPVWVNGNLVVYHGTDTQALTAHGRLHPGDKIDRFAVNLTLCRPATDFGRGFYTTTSLQQAKEWANARMRRVAAPAGLRPNLGLVLQFDLNRDWLATQETLVFVRAIQDYWDFVTHCRAGLAAHSRSLPRSPHDPYDVAYGLVTIWPSRLLIQDCDQISFHTDRAARVLRQPRVAAMALQADGGLFL